jgi:hypothetical protein
VANRALKARTRTPRERFLVTIEAAASAVAPEVRLRRALKSLGRTYGLRCKGVRRESQEPPTVASSPAPIVSTAGSSAATSTPQPVLPAKTCRRPIGMKTAPGAIACDQCGREGLRKRYGRTAFHFAPCGLPCSAGSIPWEERRERAPTHPQKCECS